MKNLPFIAIPVIIVILLLGGVMAWKVMSPPKPAVIQVGTFPSGFSGQQAAKPSNPFSALFGIQTPPVPTPTPASVSSMNQDLTTVGDDGGATDFTSLQSQASGL